MQPQNALRPGADSYRRARSPKHLEAEVFSRVTRALRGAADGTDDTMARARALADNRLLWDAVLSSVLDPANALPAALRGQIASVARSVLRECGEDAPDFGFLVEVNEQMAGGLWT